MHIGSRLAIEGRLGMIELNGNVHITATRIKTPFARGYGSRPEFFVAVEETPGGRKMITARPDNAPNGYTAIRLTPRVCATFPIADAFRGHDVAAITPNRHERIAFHAMSVIYTVDFKQRCAWAVTSPTVYYDQAFVYSSPQSSSVFLRGIEDSGYLMTTAFLPRYDIGSTASSTAGSQDNRLARVCGDGVTRCLVRDTELRLISLSFPPQDSPPLPHVTAVARMFPHPVFVSDFDVSPDGRTLAVAHTDLAGETAVSLYARRSDTELAFQKTYNWPASRLLYLSDGTRLAMLFTVKECSEKCLAIADVE